MCVCVCVVIPFILGVILHKKYLKENLNASKQTFSEHPPWIRWEHWLQGQNILMGYDLKGFPNGSSMESTV